MSGIIIRSITQVYSIGLFCPVLFPPVTPLIDCVCGRSVSVRRRAAVGGHDGKDGTGGVALGRSQLTIRHTCWLLHKIYYSGLILTHLYYSDPLLRSITQVYY